MRLTRSTLTSNPILCPSVSTVTHSTVGPRLSMSSHPRIMNVFDERHVAAKLNVSGRWRIYFVRSYRKLRKERL